MPTFEIRRPVQLAYLLLAVAVVVYIFVAGRDTTFFAGEWTFLLERQGHDAKVFLDPQGGSLSLFPVILFKGLVEVVGTDAYEIFRFVLLGLHLVVVGLVVVLVRPRLGDFGAVLAGTLVLVMGASADNLLQPGQFDFVLALIGGLAALAALDRAQALRPPMGDLKWALVACAGLILALGSSAAGAALWLLAVVEIAVNPTLRRRWWWVVAAPLVLYLAWVVGYGDNQLSWDNLAQAPQFAITMAATAAGGLFGLGAEWGRTLLLVGLAGLIWWWMRGGKPSVRLIATLLALAAFVAMTALARATTEDPEAPRYVYVAAVLIILVAAELLRGVRQPARVVPVVALAVAAVAALGVQGIHERGIELRRQADAIKLRLAAVGLSAQRVPSDYQVSKQQPQVTGEAVAVQARHGLIRDSTGRLREASAAARARIDAELLALGAFSLQVPSERGPEESECSKAPAGTPLTFSLPSASTLYVKSKAPIRVRAWRYADGPPAQPIAEVPAGPGRITFAPDEDRGVPWQLEIVSAASVSACTKAP